VGVSDSEERHRRRKAWNRAFSTAAVKGYEEILEFRLNQLVEQLELRASRAGEKESLDLASWFNRFS
jgi:cytochrome P450